MTESQQANRAAVLPPSRNGILRAVIEQKPKGGAGEQLPPPPGSDDLPPAISAENADSPFTQLSPPPSGFDALRVGDMVIVTASDEPVDLYRAPEAAHLELSRVSGCGKVKMLSDEEAVLATPEGFRVFHRVNFRGFWRLLSLLALCLLALGQTACNNLKTFELSGFGISYEKDGGFTAAGTVRPKLNASGKDVVIP